MWRIRKFFQMASAERLLLFQTAIALTIVRLGLWLLPFPTLQRLLAKVFPVLTSRPLYPLSIEQVVWTVDVVSRYMPGGVKCLARALTTQRLLVQQGHFTQLRIGVFKNLKGRLEAHAWVENHGEVVIGGLPNLSDFTTLPALEIET